MADSPKLHIDDDWKSQAQQEKQRLAEEIDTGASEAGPHAHDGLPKADFQEIVQMLATQAVISLQGMRDPASGRTIPPSPEVAKVYIDLLDVLEKKTKGNLTEEEQKMLDTVLYQLRMAYVQVMSGPARAPRPGGPAGS